MHHNALFRQLPPRALAALLCLAAPALAQAPPPPEQASPRAEKTLAAADRHMVASAHPSATRAGLEVLRNGGSAADAAVAVQMVLNLVEPQSSGIGGGAFMLHWDAASGELVTLDGRETAPAAAGLDLFLEADGTPMGFWDAVIGGRSVGTPGTLRLLERAHERWGRKEWAQLLQPAIELAENGFEISPRLAAAIAENQERGPDRFAAARAYFYDESGAPLPAGTLLKNPDFAETLRTIAKDGADAFYEGPIARDIVATVRGAESNPGLLSAEDLKGYEVVERPAVCLPYRAFEVCGMGPPSSGGLAVGQILGLLEHVDMRGLGPTADGIHMLLEASRLAFADRDTYVADSDFVRVPVAGMIDPAYLTSRAQLLGLDASIGLAQAGNPPWRDRELRAADTSRTERGTSHFVVVDGDGNAVSMTTTIESGFGSRLMVRGFLLNNELTDFSFAPEKNGRPIANRVESGKRPRSSMAPTMVFDAEGAPFLLVGSPGGSRIIGYVAQTLVGVLDWGMDVQQAIDMGRVINRNGDSELEAGTPVAALEEALAARGHTVKQREQASGLHAVMLADGKLLGGADPRREGLALGD
ncbi:gamma-glutamyltransferase [Marinimicrococcus flavescens]|uniref:Glutathione hydrolase proenzyme n=1 Tax=Marinimicrococcus flavescens TaxID=3031815 RepID=A0AAP4D5A0_9PROT|nr:gamma-glutamyltransferase [Marinimicrococcus flavescens]